MKKIDVLWTSLLEESDDSDDEHDRSDDDENGLSDDGHYISDYDYPSS